MKRKHQLLIIIRMYPTSPSIIKTRGCQFYWWWKPEYPEKTTNLYHIMVHQVHLTWVGFELTTLVVICTDGIGSCKSNYHTMTTTTASYVSSIRLVVSSIRLVVSSIRLVLSSNRTTLTTWPPVTTCCLVYYIFYGD